MRARHPGTTLLAVGTLVLGACSDSSGSSTTTAVPAASTSPLEATSDTEPSGEIIPAALWALTSSGDLLHLDPESGEVLGTSSYSTDDRVSASGAYAAGNLWISVVDSGELLRVSTTDGSIAEHVAADGGSPCCLVAGEGQLWASDAEEGQVSRLDPATGRVTQHIAVDEPLGRVLVGPGAAYVLLDDSDEIVRIDETGSIKATTTVAGLDIFGAVTDNTLWVANQEGLVALDATTLAPIRTIAGIFPFDLEALGGELWVADSGDALAQIDGTTGDVTQSVTMTDPLRLEVAPDRVYVVDKAGHIYLATGAGLRALTGTPKGIVQVVFSPPHHAG